MYILVCAYVPSDADDPAGSQMTRRFFFYNTEWNLCPLNKDSQEGPEGFSVPRPKNLAHMVEAAKKLCHPFPFVRVNLYDVEDIG